MPIVNQEVWESWINNNKDPYGKACIDVARRAMEILDDVGEFDCSEVIIAADKSIDAGGITGFMAGCVAQMIAKCHSRGKEFLIKWNKETQIGDEGEVATQRGNVLNPAILSWQG